MIRPRLAKASCCSYMGRNSRSHLGIQIPKLLIPHSLLEVLLSFSCICYFSNNGYLLQIGHCFCPFYIYGFMASYMLIIVSNRIIVVVVANCLTFTSIFLIF
jgi:hypothetical protein